MNETNIDNRNYSTISISAKMLLLLKGLTNIPFARQAAELISYPDKYIPDYTKRDITFWARTVHFERRYWSIDNLLQDIPITNILEFSSGFSFRGLEATRQKGIHYIDTDLPDLVTSKKEFITALKKECLKTAGTLEILPLNVLDEKQFQEIVGHFPPGPVVIVNEGLMMYLDMNEKEKLCKNIHSILKERGGYWITADVYIKKQIEKLNLKYDDTLTKFLKEHAVHENRFESYEAAKDLFHRMGFVVDKEASVERSKLSSLKYLIKSTSTWQLLKMRNAGKIQATWRLKVANV